MRFKKGEIYELEFFDHTISEEEELVTCKAVGYYASQDKNRISIYYWITDHPEFKHSKEVTNIAKSAIINIRKLTF